MIGSCLLVICYLITEAPTQRNVVEYYRYLLIRAKFRMAQGQNSGAPGIDRFHLTCNALCDA